MTKWRERERHTEKKESRHLRQYNETKLNLIQRKKRKWLSLLLFSLGYMLIEQ